MLLYIIGFTRAGKSTFARKLAQGWRIPYWDTDEIFVNQEEQSIAEYTNKYGWNAFRERESEILVGIRSHSFGSRLLSQQGFRGVLACGGGIVESSQNRDLLKQERVLWLSPSWETLYRRIRETPSAITQGMSEPELWQLYQRRLPLYRECINGLVTPDSDS